MSDSEDQAMSKLAHALGNLYEAAPSGDDFRLLLVMSNATQDRNKELFDQSEKLDKAKQEAKLVLREYLDRTILKPPQPNA